MLDYQEYIIDEDEYQDNGNGYHGNGYDQLDGDWALYYKVSKGFTKRVKPEDREDFLHDLLLVMARVKTKYQTIGKPLTEAGLIRVACYEVADYWRKWYKRKNGIDCGQCSKAQREKCKEWFLLGDNDCPKAIKTSVPRNEVQGRIICGITGGIVSEKTFSEGRVAQYRSLEDNCGVF